MSKKTDSILVIKLKLFLKKVILSNKQYACKEFKKKLGVFPDLKNPLSFNEKIQWLKLNYRNPLMQVCADKYEVRKFIEERIGMEYLIPLYALFDSNNKLRFEKLPESGALKATHGSGWNIIYRTKKEVIKSELYNDYKRWINLDYYKIGREWAYKGLKRRVLCEELLLDEKGNSPSDFKFFCFNGNVKYIQVDLERFENHRRVFFDEDWNLQDFGLIYDRTCDEVEKPKEFNKMKELAKVLSKDFPFVRVDLYNAHGRIYFGELTFYPENGTGRFIPKEWDDKLGELLELPKRI